MPPKAGGVSNQDQSGLCSTPADVATTAEPEKIGKSGNDKPSTRSHMHINPSNAENQSSSDATRAAGGSTNPAEPDLERKGHSYPLPDTADMTVAAYASASGLDDGYAKAGTEEDLGLSVLGRGGLRPDSRSHKRHSFALPEVPGFALAELSMDRGAGTQSRVDILLEQHTDILDRQGLAPSEFHEGPSSQPMQNGDADGAGGRTRIWRNFGAQSRDPGGPHGMTPFHRQPPAFGPRMLASRNTRVKSLVHECDDFLKATELGTTAGCGTHQQASGTGMKKAVGL